ncbi:MAG: tetratricopeptide repeat protein [Methylococcaceae bacterium]|nr:tetratricopeptide repeat protein [Methylococcaceae bacterium]
MTESTNAEISEEASQQISLAEALQLAIRLHQANEFEFAQDIYQKLLDVTPDNPDLLHFFGLLKHQRGFSEDGAELIKKALILLPDYVDAENNLGNIYLQTGQPELAEPRFRRVLELNPKLAAAYGNLGIALKDLDNYSEAIELLLKATQLEPENAYHYQNLGNVYRKLKQYPEAVNMFRKSLELRPFDSEAYRKLSLTFYFMGEIEHCIEVLDQWLSHDPENPTALHMHAAYSRSNTPSRASDAYVRQTFDGFAASFDAVLKRLDYRAPFLVEDALLQLNPDTNWNLLDAGCGTGLCGALVRPLVKRLVGVDLSSKMLERANARGVYDELIEAELTAFYSQANAEYDAMTCVDTLCYFGDLTEVISASVNSLKPKGYFLFTLEKLEEDGAEKVFRLNLHGRYSHTEAYVRKTLTNAGFQILRIENSVLRKEGREQVLGLVVTAQLS